MLSYIEKVPNLIVNISYCKKGLNLYPIYQVRSNQRP